MSSDPHASPATEFFVEPDPIRGFVRIRVRGKLAMQEVQRSQAEVSAAHPRLHRLWDLREADIGDWTAAAIRSAIEAMAARTFGEQGVGIRVAGLMTRDLDFGVGRMFESMATDALPMRGAVFRDEARAMEWLLTGE